VFVVQTPRSRIMRMSTSGCRDLLSASIQASKSSPAAMSSEIVRASCHPQVGAFADRWERVDHRAA
jgi:hypothetical protein